MESEENKLTDEECIALFDALFPAGFAGADVLSELAPNGWEQSTLVSVFHPTVEMVFEESLRIHRNMNELFAKRPGVGSARPEPTLDEIRQQFQPTPIDESTEVVDLVGRCLWSVFSDNHDVIASDGRIADLGSFRGSGGFIADYLNLRLIRRTYDYMDFYMGAMWTANRADLTPVYRMIFRRLQKSKCDWRYSFPRLQLVDFRPLKKQLEQGNQPEWENYDPEKALEQDREVMKHEQEIQKMRDQRNDGYRESVAAAQSQPPPVTVQAYRDIFGQWPVGWPPEMDDCPRA